MFILKLKGDILTQKVNSVKLKVKTNIKTITSDNEMDELLKKYEPEDLMIEVYNEFKPVWNLYYKDFDNAWMCEGVDCDGD